MLLVTGPVTKNMREALERTYDATPDAQMGGRGRRLRAGRRRVRRQLRVRRRRRDVVPVDLHIRGCPRAPSNCSRGCLRSSNRRPLAAAPRNERLQCDQGGEKCRRELAREARMAIERIDYQAGSVAGKGALVWSEKISAKRPLLLVMPNWLGVTDNAIQRAQKMAGDKYVAFVGCMYGGGQTCEGPPTSQEWMMAVRADRVEGRKRVNAALATLVAEADKRGIGDRSKKAAVGILLRWWQCPGIGAERGRP